MEITLDIKILETENVRRIKLVQIYVDNVPKLIAKNSFDHYLD